jgi:hypothetical protein
MINPEPLNGYRKFEGNMLVIRKEQMDIIRTSLGKKRFTDRIVNRLKKMLPEKDEQDLLEVAQYGILRAEQNQFITERDICQYIDLMAVFGKDFDKDPELPWVKEVLNNQSFNTTSEKMNHLYDIALENQNQGKGLDHLIE